MVKIESATGIKEDVKCIGCSLQKGDIKTIGDILFESNLFEVRQDHEIPIIGFFAISTKRHIVGFADFTEDEKREFIDILSKLRKGMKDLLKIKYVQYLCKEEVIESKINPSHFHMALFPKHKWAEDFSSIGNALEHAKKNMKTESDLNKVKEAAEKIKIYLAKKTYLSEKDIKEFAVKLGKKVTSRK